MQKMTDSIGRSVSSGKVMSMIASQTAQNFSLVESIDLVTALHLALITKTSSTNIVYHKNTLNMILNPAKI
jgi:hypothetical protein